MSVRNEVVNKAREWLGVRFRHQGRSRSGVDCVGLVLKVHEEVFSENREITGYSRRPNQKEVWSIMNRNLTKIKKEEAGPGDVVLMAFDTGATHLGILTENSIIHAFIQARKVVEQPIDSQIIVGYFKLPGVN